MKKIVLKASRYDILEHILFLILGIFSIHFFEERLYADASFYIFKVIDHESLWVEHNRFILIFSQILPWIGVKLGFGLKAVLLLYSIGHVLFFYVIFLLTKYHYGNNESGILLLLIQTLGIMSGFFVPMFELYYSTGLLVIFTSILYHPKKKKNLPVLIVLSLFILTGHPFAYILYFFTLALHAEKFKFEFIRYYIVFIALIIAVFIFKKFTATEYEQGKTTAFINNYKYAVYDMAYLKSLIAFLGQYYKEMLFLELITIILLIISKDFLKLTLVVTAFLATLVIVNISNHGFLHTRYQEQVYFPLSFLVAYPFTRYAVNSKSDMSRMLFTIISVVVICIRIFVIWNDGKVFNSRIEELKFNIEMARSMPGTKFVVAESNLKHDPNWSYPLETILLSSYDTDKKTVTICTSYDIEFNENLKNLLSDQYLFRRWEVYDVNTLNEKYFKLDNSEYSFLDITNDSLKLDKARTRNKK